MGMLTQSFPRRLRGDPHHCRGDRFSKDQGGQLLTCQRRIRTIETLRFGGLSTEIGELSCCLASAMVVEDAAERSEEHRSELQSLMRTSYAVFCLKHKR